MVTLKPSGSRWVDISMGDAHVCAISSTNPGFVGQMYCWGLGTDHQTSWPSRFDYASVDAGARHTCATTLTGGLVCWGSNSTGQARPPAGLGFVQVSAGAAHTCARRNTSDTVCWGSAT